MDFEEREIQRRKQAIKVIISEIGMFFSVIMIVVVATLAAMGFFVSSNGTIEQTGLLQVHSLPTGATVELDGTTLFSRTNLSRSLVPSEHQIKLSRDGYDTWSKTISLSSGMLLRLYYPRLFALNRTAESVLSLSNDLDFYVPSDDQLYIAYATKLDPHWKILNVHGDDATVAMTLDMSNILPGVNAAGVFEGKIESLRWSNNNDHILVQVSYEGAKEWIVVNIKDVKQSLNLTKTFGLAFSQVEMIDNSATQLFALENHQLRRINTSDQSISRVLLNHIESFANFKTDVVYVAQEELSENNKQQKVGIYHDGDKGGVEIATVTSDEKVRVVLTKYYDERYLAYTVGDEMTVLYGSLPVYQDKATEADLSDLQALFVDAKLKTVPESLRTSPEGEYIIARSGAHLMVVDLEMGELYEYEAAANSYWVDEGLLGVVADDMLKVWDFDNTNHRTLVQKVMADDATTELMPVTTRTTSTLLNYPVVISDNNRWLYYLVQEEIVDTERTVVRLVREQIRN